MAGIVGGAQSTSLESEQKTERRGGEEMAMNICRFCGCTESQARADAMALAGC
jgi:hypothetical protein